MSPLWLLLLLCLLRLPGRRRRQLWRSVGKPGWCRTARGTVYDQSGVTEAR